MNNQPDRPRFTAFCSFKGGVGRSMALSNVAYEMVKAGRRVLIMDFDLEAPGQHHSDLFNWAGEGLEGRWRPERGLIDLIGSYRRYQQPEPAATVPTDSDTAGEIEGAPFEWKLASHIYRSLPLEAFFNRDEVRYGLLGGQSSAGELWLLPAGAAESSDYPHQLAGLNWKEFYQANGRAFLRELKGEIGKLGFDEVLIDSRTGLSDVFYISALELAETVVLISGFNRQNIAGTKRAFELLSSEAVFSGFGAKRVLLVGSPAPASGHLVDDRLREIRRSGEWPGLLNFDAVLPYNMDMALWENTATWSADQHEQSPSGYVLQLRQLQKLIASGSSPKTQVFGEDPTRPGNPFELVRKDYFSSEEVARYYVDPGGVISSAINEFSPLVVTGVRGSGKTMLAGKHSIEVWLAERGIAEGMPVPDKILAELRQVGLFFRIDADFLHAFNQGAPELRPNYDRLFSQFFDIVLIRKALRALQRLGGVGYWCDENALFQALYREFGVKPTPACTSEAFLDFLEDQLSQVRFYLNNPEEKHRPVMVQANVMMKLLCERLGRAGRWGRRYFAVLFDEYENLENHQQRVINTRLKQTKREDLVTYRLFMRSGGLRTRETLAPQQRIEETHDYREYSLDDWLSHASFKKQVVQIADRYLELHPYFRELGVHTEDLFESWSAEREAEVLGSGGREERPLFDWVRKNLPPAKQEVLLPWLDQEPSLLRRGVAVVLVNQGKDPATVVDEFQNKTKLAGDWYHNYHRGALLWLCRLYRRPKVYAGLDQLVSLSGNNVRTFLDFCHAIVATWMRKETVALPIGWQDQNDAIRAQARTFHSNLRSLDRSDAQLNLFYDRLGRLFEVMQKSPRQSEVEINHFSVAGSLNDPKRAKDLSEWLNDAWYCGLLRQLRGNKEKSVADLRQDDWQLAPWFAPNFGISPRRKKKVALKPEQLYTLFAGDDAAWRALYREFERRHDTWLEMEEEGAELEADSGQEDLFE